MLDYSIGGRVCKAGVTPRPLFNYFFFFSGAVFLADLVSVPDQQLKLSRQEKQPQKKRKSN